MPHDSKIPPLIRQNQAVLLENWVREQMVSENVRPDLMKEGELRDQSRRFLEALSDVASSANFNNVMAESWAPVRNVLAEVSRSRGRQGFSSAETASFVFSLKQPLVSLLREQGGEKGDDFFQELWAINALLDKLGIYTTEVHLQAREEVIRRQQEEMLELSTPVVKLWDGILALPLIGTLDSARTSVVMESLLESIVQTGSEIAIIDITGVPTVDTLVAQHLLKTVAAARLMGADCIISGIRPQIAQTMVHLAIDLSSVVTKSSLAEALLVALKRRGVAIVKE